jgi:O-antigen/teichoic acid export membrane protein
VASRFGNAARLIPHAGFASALPLLSYECEHGEPEGLRREFHGMVRWFAVLAAIGLASAARPVLVLTYGASFASAAPVLVWIAIGLVPSLVNNARKVFLYASGRERVAVRWTTVSMAVQLVSAAALIPTFGAVGAAIALLLGEVVIWWPLREVRGVPEDDGAKEVGGVDSRHGIQNVHNG